MAPVGTNQIGVAFAQDRRRMLTRAGADSFDTGQGEPPCEAVSARQ